MGQGHAMTIGNQTAETTLPLARRYWVAAAFLFVLLAAGGASRADVVGQGLVRLGAWALIIGAILFLPRPEGWTRNVIAWILAASVVLPLIQLVPLPPDIWTALPARDLLASVTEALETPPPWRPISLSPGGTFNALASLVVPVAVFVFVDGFQRREHRALLTLLLAMVCMSALLAVFQVAGAGLPNPLINMVPGAVSGSFANRNHFALFMASGCVLVGAWAAAQSGRTSQWRLPAALLAFPLFLLLSLASGSRSGTALTVAGIFVGLWLARDRMRAVLSRYGTRGRAVAGAAVLSLFAGVIVASVIFSRAEALQRAVDLQGGEDLRSKAFETVLQLARIHFPFGSGFGTFDPAYRIVEPDHLLQNAYFNHAHNDIMEIAVDGGAPALVILAVAMAWLARASFRIWRSRGSDQEQVFGRAGSAILVLVVSASVVDYPARTPMIMSLCVIASLWLWRAEVSSRKAFKPSQQSASGLSASPLRAASSTAM